MTPEIIMHRANDLWAWKVAADKGYSIEVDIRCARSVLWMGHDDPGEIFEPTSWPGQGNAYIHAKDIYTMQIMSNFPNMTTRYFDTHKQLDIFYHDFDDAVFTMKGKIWLHPKKFDALFNGSVTASYNFSNVIVALNDRMIVEPEKLAFLKTFGGVCTDFPEYYEHELGKT